MVLDEPKDLVGQGSGPLGSLRAVAGKTAKTALHSNNILPETEYDAQVFSEPKPTWALRDGRQAGERRSALKPAPDRRVSRAQWRRAVHRDAPAIAPGHGQARRTGRALRGRQRQDPHLRRRARSPAMPVAKPGAPKGLRAPPGPAHSRPRRAVPQPRPRRLRPRARRGL